MTVLVAPSEPPELRALHLFTPQQELSFWERVQEDEDGCWIWTGSCDALGYGTVRISARGFTETWSAHRVAYLIRHGEVPAGMELDHLCRKPPCVRHLEAVSRSENVRRGYAAGSRFRSHCRQGHEFTAENTYINPQANDGLRRQCRTCILERSRERYYTKLRPVHLRGQ